MEYFLPKYHDIAGKLTFDLLDISVKTSSQLNWLINFSLLQNIVIKSAFKKVQYVGSGEEMLINVKTKSKSTGLNFLNSKFK